MSFRKPVVVKRSLPGQYVGGVWQPGSEDEIVIRASVQPAKPEDTQLLPEGRRNLATYRLYTSDELVISKEGSDAVPDRALINGEDFEVLALAHWDNGVINHRKYIVVRVQP